MAAALADGLKELARRIRSGHTLHDLVAVGHRIVHGGERYDRPVLINDAVLEDLVSLEPLAPLHQQANLQLVAECRRQLPHVPHIACFDTAFHSGMPPEASTYALPPALTDAGLRAYGFHGISFEYIWRHLQQRDGLQSNRRTIIAHLGSGASLCAIANGKSIATTMGFSTADGLPMATRSGSIDPGLVIHLVREFGMTADDLENLIYRNGGLKALSGLSGDMRELRASEDPRAKAAISLFVYRIVGEIGRLAAALGGLDTLILTGGIGANDAALREEIERRMSWMGGDIDIEQIATDEEAMLAEHAAARFEHGTANRISQK